MNLHVKLESLGCGESLIALLAFELGCLHVGVLVASQLGLVGCLETTDLANVAFSLLCHFNGGRGWGQACLCWNQHTFKFDFTHTKILY